jgi:TRAP-type C4-dicarboxylate transport system permease small subunit
MEWLRPLDRPAAGFARYAGLVVVGLSLIAAAVLVLLPLLGRGFVRAVELLAAGCVWVATSISVGVSIWDVLRTIGQAAAGELATPAASVALALLVLVGLAALYLLQRLLESEEESPQ